MEELEGKVDPPSLLEGIIWRTPVLSYGPMGLDLQANPRRIVSRTASLKLTAMCAASSGTSSSGAA